jgi:hypothetical protein
MRQIDTREGARRRHRAISLFAVIQCWQTGLDGVVFERNQLERVLGMEKFQEPRLNWLTADLREFFPYQQILKSGRGTKFSSLFVSRLPLKPYLPTGRMSNQERIKRIPEGGPKIGFFKLWIRPSYDKFNNLKDSIPLFADWFNYDERLLSSFLALLVQGEISPKEMLSRIEGKQK